MKHTYLLIDALPSITDPYWTNLKSPQKNFRRRLYNFLCLKLRSHWTEFHQISKRCTEMTSDYSAEIKIAIFQYVSKSQRDEWRSSSNCRRFAAKIERFNSENSENIGQMFTKFLHDVRKWLPIASLLRWNQKRDLPIHIRTPEWRMTIYRKIAGESRQNCAF